MTRSGERTSTPMLLRKESSCTTVRHHHQHRYHPQASHQLEHSSRASLTRWTSYLLFPIPWETLPFVNGALFASRLLTALPYPLLAYRTDAFSSISTLSTTTTSVSTLSTSGTGSSTIPLAILPPPRQVQQLILFAHPTRWRPSLQSRGWCHFVVGSTSPTWIHTCMDSLSLQPSMDGKHATSLLSMTGKFYPIRLRGFKTSFLGSTFHPIPSMLIAAFTSQFMTHHTLRLHAPCSILTTVSFTLDKRSRVQSVALPTPPF